MNGNLENSVRINGVILLKKNLVIGKNKPSLFLNLSAQSRAQLQIQMLTFLNELDNDPLINQIADFLGDMASSLYNDKVSNLPESEKWGELVNHLFDLYKTGKVRQMNASLRILETLVEQTQEKLQFFANQFKELIQAGFQDQNQTVKISICKLLMTVAIQFKPSVTKNFKALFDQVLLLMDQLVNNNNEDQIKELMTKLIDVCLVSPHFVKRKYGDLIHVMGRVRELDPD